MMLKLYIGEDLLDLFNDESIELNSSITNIEDISKNTTDYAKSFTVPATNVNNRIFKHYYDANIDNAFDARVKVDGRIELDGMPFRIGKISLEKVIVKQNKPYSYSINFVGNLVSLKDKLKNDELSILDLSIYDHGYNSSQVKMLLQGGNDLIYNLFVKKQLYYNSTADNTNTTALANIAFTGGTNTGVDWYLLRPSLRLKAIIEAIEVKYDLVFSRDFFGTSEFTNLFMWLNNDSNADGRQPISEPIDITNVGTVTNPNIVVDIVDDTIQTFGIIAPSGGGQWNIKITITPSSGYENVAYSISKAKDSNIGKTYSKLKGTTINSFPTFTSQTEFNYKVTVVSEFKFTSKIQFITSGNGGGSGLSDGIINNPEQTIGTNVIISNNIPKIKIIDFLKGLFSLFKLVLIPQDDGTLYVDTITNFYATGGVWNISRYVKTDTLEVSRGKLLNELKFNFKDPTTILNAQFKKSTGLGYGDEEVLLTDDGTPTGKPLEGESLNVEVPFEQIIYDRLLDIVDDSETNIMYGSVIDESLAPVSPSPHIFYNINTAIGTKTIGYINDVGVKEQLIGNINTPSHSIDRALPQYNLNFGIENEEYTNISSENTLYSNHYKDYVESIFNIKRRSFKYSALLPLRILLQLKLNDILEIKNNYYRIDNFNLNLLTREITLNLINAFDLVIAGFSSDVTNLIADYTAQTQSVNVPNMGNSTISFNDGTWLSDAIVGTNAFFTFTQNNTGLERTDIATITNTDTLQEIEIFITQYGTTVTADNGTITADSNLITADNG